FFQAEDGIRDRTVTGVQTCALPISLGLAESDRLAVAEEREVADFDLVAGVARRLLGQPDAGDLRPAIGAARDAARVELMHVVERSEERRVGKECRVGWAAAP